MVRRTWHGSQKGTFGSRNGKPYKNGTYRITSHHRTKSGAESTARAYRRKGYLAKVTKIKSGYAVSIGLTRRR
jgi:hypothetical protein